MTIYLFFCVCLAVHILVYAEKSFQTIDIEKVKHTLSKILTP
jgi:hypothetical protein